MAALAIAPTRRGERSAVGVYRLWRDLGYAAGGLIVSIIADAVDESAAIFVVGLITASSGIVVALCMQEDRRWSTLLPEVK